MANQGACTLSVLLLSIAAAAWVTAVPTAQAGTDALRRNLYGPESPEFFGFLDDHESAREKGTEAEQQPSRLAAGNAMIGSSSDGRSTRGQMIEGYSREEDAIDRLLRNLDHIGGGNLLRRGLSNSRRWTEFRRNLDQIGGGNLLRDVEDRGERNLDHIGGGNLVRNLDSVLVEADHIRRNLDQIGGGNLVRSLSEAARELQPRPRSEES